MIGAFTILGPWFESVDRWDQLENYFQTDIVFTLTTAVVFLGLALVLASVLARYLRTKMSWHSLGVFKLRISLFVPCRNILFSINSSGALDSLRI